MTSYYRGQGGLQVKWVRGRDASDGLIIEAGSGEAETECLRGELRALGIAEIGLETDAVTVDFEEA